MHLASASQTKKSKNRTPSSTPITPSTHTPSITVTAAQIPAILNISIIFPQGGTFNTRPPSQKHKKPFFGKTLTQTTHHVTHLYETRNPRVQNNNSKPSPVHLRPLSQTSRVSSTSSVPPSPPSPPRPTRSHRDSRYPSLPVSNSRLAVCDCHSNRFHRGITQPQGIL